MADRFSYPVIVEYTHRHVVWVNADGPKDAADRLQSEPYERTSDNETLAESWWEVREPRPYDWTDIYGYCTGPYAVEADAHVEWHRIEMRRQQLEAERVACRAAGHPETEGRLSDGRVWCKGCREYLAEAVGRA